MKLRFKHSADRAERLESVVARIRNLPEGRPLSRRMMARMVFAWGNFGYSASLRYLQQVERIFRSSDGVVLECGSGATTLLLALLAEKYDRRVWTFEHHEGWGQHIRDVLGHLNLSQVTVCCTPLRNYGSFEWYELPDTAPSKDIGMVVCDGPPGSIQGGRYGLIPVMHAYMRADCRILLDDTHRKKEKALIRRWSSEHRLQYKPLGTTGCCTEIVFV